MIIGVTGFAGSGKDTIADILVRDHNFIKVALADPIKRICRDLFAFTDEQLWGPSKARNAPDRRYPRTETAHEFLARMTALLDAQWLEAVSKEFGKEVAEHFLTTRHALQQLGTEWGRDCYPDVWVNYAMRIAKRLLDDNAASAHNGCLYSAKMGLVYVNTDECPAGVVISDVRFPNEVAAIRAAGGVLWRATHGAGLVGPAGAHESEQHIALLKVDAVVPDVTLAELPFIVSTMLHQAKEGCHHECRG